MPWLTEMKLRKTTLALWRWQAGQDGEHGALPLWGLGTNTPLSASCSFLAQNQVRHLYLAHLCNTRGLDVQSKAQLWSFMFTSEDVLLARYARNTIPLLHCWKLTPRELVSSLQCHAFLICFVLGNLFWHVAELPKSMPLPLCHVELSHCRDLGQMWNSPFVQMY